MTAAEIEALGGYYGATPRPDDFESFWQARMAEADAVPLHYTVTQAQEVPSWDSCEFLDLWFTGMEGARLYAKFYARAGASRCRWFCSFTATPARPAALPSRRRSRAWAWR